MIIKEAQQWTLSLTRALLIPGVIEITLINAALASSVCLILEATSSSPAFPTQLLLF